MLRRVRVRVRVACLEPTWWRTEQGDGGAGGVVDEGLVEPDAAADEDAALVVWGGGGERGVACGAGIVMEMKSYREQDAL